jgi:hypothetical protein
MADSMREILIKASISHFQGHIDKHIANVENYFRNSVGVGEHPDVMESIESEIAQIADYDDKLEMLKKYFIQDGSSDPS